MFNLDIIYFYICATVYYIVFMKKKWLLFGFLLYAGVSQSQSIYGLITDKSSGEALIGANIITENNQGVASDINGQYTLNLQEGSHRITFKYIGYNDVIQQITLKKDERKIFRKTTKSSHGFF